MRIAIYGAGAIGGYLGCGLACADVDVTMIARGRTLEAIRDRGLIVHIDGETRNARPKATDDTAAAGPQDAVIIAVKANAAPGIVDRMLPLLGPETMVVTAQNGIPWWYFYKHDGPLEGSRLKSIDPGGVQWDKIGPERAVGCVVYPATEVISPGEIKHVSLNRFALGEPDGTKSERVQALANVLKSGGFSVPVKANIRDEIWIKLWGNLSFNPVSALTGGTLEQMASDDAVRPVIRNMMLEAKAIGEALGVKFAVDIETRIDGAGKVGAHRTSMLQDFDAGRAPEINALVTVIQELGQLTGTATPTIDAVSALVQQKAQIASIDGA